MNLLESAEKLEKKGDYLGSLGLVLKVLKNEPDNLRALELKASLCLIKGREPESIRIYEKLLGFYEGDDKIWKQLFALSTLSSAYSRLKSLDKAISCCEKSIAICERFLKIEGPHKDSFVEELFGRLWMLGEYQFKSGNYSSDVDAYTKMLELNLEFGCLESIAETLHELARAYHKANDTTEALSKYSLALRLYNAFEDSASVFDLRAKVHYSIGTILLGARDYEETLFHAEKCALYLEKAYARINDLGYVGDDSTYKKARRMQKALKKNKSLWKK